MKLGSKEAERLNECGRRCAQVTGFRVQGLIGIWNEGDIAMSNEGLKKGWEANKLEGLEAGKQGGFFECRSRKISIDI